MTCEMDEASAVISLSFNVCREHGLTRFVGGTIEANGVNPLDLIEGMLAYSEYLIKNAAAEKEEIVSFLSSTFRNAVKKKESWSFNDDDKDFFIGLLAHTLLVRQVVNRQYPRSGVGGFLNMTPLDDRG